MPAPRLAYPPLDMVDVLHDALRGAAGPDAAANAAAVGARNRHRDAGGTERATYWADHDGRTVTLHYEFRSATTRYRMSCAAVWFERRP